MFGFHFTDILVIILYFSWLIWIGFRSMKKIHNEEDFFLGGRKFGKLIATFSMFGQATGGESGASSTTMVKQMGMAGSMFAVSSNFILLPIYFFSAKWMRRLRILTLATYYEERYESRSMGAVYAISQALYFVLVIALSFMAISKTIEAMTPKPYEALSIEQKAEVDQAVRLQDLEHTSFTDLTAAEQEEMTALRTKDPHRQFSWLNRKILITVLALIVLVYAVGGGLEAAAKTDVIQSIFLLGMTIILIPSGIAKINEIHGSSGFFGAFETMHTTLPQSFFELMGAPGNPMTWYLMLAMLLAIPGALCVGNQLVAAGAARDDRTAMEGFVNGVILKRFAAVLWSLVGMIILTVYVTYSGDPDLLWGKASRELLGPLNMGLVGLMTACLMSGLMSSADTHMLTVAAMLTDSVYKPLVPNKSQKHYVFVGRIFSGCYLISGVMLATLMDDMWTFFKYVVTFNLIFAAPFLMGILWRRANRFASWTAVIVVSATSLIIPIFASGLVRDRFLDETESVSVTQTYVATPLDEINRNQEIRDWQELKAKGEAVGTCPKEAVAGEKFSKVFVTKPYAVFWDGIENIEKEDGTVMRRGKGLLKLELLMLEACGVRLSKLPYAGVESLRFVMKFLIAFLPFLVAAALTRRPKKDLLDQFYGRLRTPAVANRETDAAEMALTRADPTRFDDQKLFRNSDWEINRWTRYEWFGIAKISVWVCLIYVLLYVVAGLGA